MSARLTAKETIRTAPFARRPSRVTSSRARSAPTRAMAKEIISTDTSAAAAGPYNQAVKVGNTVYVSGQIGLTPAMEFAGDSIEEQTEQVMKNIGEVLAAAGATYEDVVKTTIMLADMSDFKTVNAIYGKRFPENSPARATIEAKGLPLGALVEIDAIAVVDAVDGGPARARARRRRETRLVDDSSSENSTRRDVPSRECFNSIRSVLFFPRRTSSSRVVARAEGRRRACPCTPHQS